MGGARLPDEEEGMIRLRLKKKHPGIPTPRYATDGAAGLDLCADKICVLQPGQILRVPTGIHAEIPDGYEGQVRPRSGLASQGIVAILGTIDSDYRGEIHVILENRRREPFVVYPGDRIAQLVIAPVARVVVDVVEDLSETARGEGGFGSTGSTWSDSPHVREE